MTHEDLRERLLDLAYGELSPRDAREVEEHAAACETCRAELARIRGTRALMSRLPEEPAPAGGERILVAAAREAMRGREPRRVLPRWLWAAPIAAASLAAVVALSLRLGAVRPPSAAREDPNALLGGSPYARAPELTQAEPDAAPAAPAGGSAPAPRATARAEQERAQRQERVERRLAERRAVPAPSPAAEPPARYATAPEGPTAPERRADAAPPPAAPPAVAAAPAPAPAAGLAAPAPGTAFALRAPAVGAPTSGEAKAEAAPQRAAKAKAARPQAARDEAARSDAGADAVARYEDLRRNGQLRAEFRAFPGCPREPWRRVERDPDGRVVSYARELLEGARRLRLEAVYASDGSVARARTVDAITGAPVPSASFRAPPPGEIDLDAPTVCDR